MTRYLSNHPNRRAGFLVFGLLFWASTVFMVPHITKTSPLAQAADRVCVKQTPYSYTGHETTDGIFCILVGFFQTLHSGAGERLFSIDFFASLLAPGALPILEASRRDRPLAIAFPIIYLTIAQLYGGGFVLPLYWALFFISGAGDNISPLGQTQAESVLVGLLLGYCVPTVAMFLHLSDAATAFWQPFPLWISIIQQLYLFVRPRSSTPQSGYQTMQVTLFVIFLCSSVVHLAAILPIVISNPTTFIPKIFALLPPTNPPTTSEVSATLAFLKWDGIFIFAAAFIAPLLFTTSLEDMLRMTGWLVVGSLVFGPGAAIAGAWAWKEAKFEEKRLTKAAKGD